MNEFNSKSSDQISRLKLQLTSTVKSLEFNKKRVPHTVVGRKELLEQIEGQEEVIDSLAYLSSPERAREYLKNINDKLKDTEDALLHSVIGRETLIKKINQQKAYIFAFKKIMPSSDLVNDLSLSEEVSSDESKDIVTKRRRLLLRYLNYLSRKSLH